ncbi:FimB/Mfa2 family fimbrial subunit [Alistipes senegalensis]|uniref:FimB/Mfa2 family fimbrial subunit n=1 Tax=Alistipes senegalensis JC50 TaxID=1033732 RepID=A0ABY5V4Q8_9BACT|nr:FimB/Mfa2 family fimbrial subunit [Alistipes senegalensis]UEA87805.1 FimB/Mfa2 family fimbrial subunit [Alistipes senegalensis]UWN64605.1 FimB/Mfa2 family fimbrial subunit [Alistipes senegalensis JC50]
MSSLSIFVFDNADNFVIRRDLTSSELVAKSATFSLPKSAAGTECSFYAVANYDASSAKTRAALTALVENSAAAYNGTFAEVSTAAKRSGGFVMSGSVTKTVGAENTTTNIGITLKRTVAKVALQTTIDPFFSQKYGGSLTVNSVKLSKAASQSLVVAGTPMPGTMTFSHTQTPAAASGKYNALFYCFENGALTAGNRVLLEINATYDLDGNASTTDDRSEVTYSVELTGKAAGEILRNGYYRVSANITGLVGQDCVVSVTVADWETPVTQNVELGA